MSNQQRGKKKIKSSKELHYQEKQESKYQKKELEKAYQQQQSDFNKMTKEELLQQLPNRLLNSIQQQFKKIEQSNLKFSQSSKDVAASDMNLTPLISQFHSNIFTQYCTYQSSQNQQLNDFIRGNPEKQYQLQQLPPITFENPLSSKINRLQELAQIQ